MNVASSPAPRASLPTSVQSSGTTTASAKASPSPAPSPPPGGGQAQPHSRDTFEPSPSPGPAPVPPPAPSPAPTGQRPAALGEKEILDSARQYLTSKGQQAPSSDADVRKMFRENDDLRRDFLFAKGMEDRGGGATAVEMFSNVVQRSRALLTEGEGDKKKIDGGEVGRDVGLLFAGTESPGKGLPVVGELNNRWNLSRGDPNVDGDGLKPTGFKEDRLNDDGGADEDQTHHIAFYTMVGSAWDNWAGEKAAKAAVRVADAGHPNDIRLGDDGVDLGRKLDDPNLDVNAWIWDRVGDPSNV